MQTPSSRERGEKLFLDHLETIEEVIRFVSGRALMRDAEAEDFASYVKLRLIENDYLVLRQFKGRSGITKFISVVVHRMLLDYRNHLWGKWRSSTEAKRLGPLAVVLERTLYRDGRSLTEAFPACRTVDPAITMDELEKLVVRLPRRTPRPRPMSIESAADELRVAAEVASRTNADAERNTLSRSTGTAVRAAIRDLPENDRLLLRLHFGADLTLAEVARVMKMPQKPLYRQMKRCLRELRRSVEARGITASVIEEVLSGRARDLDFGFETEK